MVKLFTFVAAIIVANSMFSRNTESNILNVSKPLKVQPQKKLTLKTANSGYNNSSLNNGLIAFYPFNGNANDESGNSRNGKVKGAVLVGDRFGKPNSAYAFTGKSNSLCIPGFQLSSINTTITSWVKASCKEGETILESSSKIFKLLLKVTDNKYQIEITIGTGKYYLSDPAAQFPVTPDNPRFDFLTIYYDGSYFYFFINNTLTDFFEYDVNSLNLTFPITFKNNINFKLNGIVDDIRIYNRELLPEEMLTLYNDRVIDLPSVTTNAVNVIGRDFAKIDYSLNSSEINESGLCWSTQPNPDTASRIVDGAIIKGLKPATNYYVRAYAINAAGVGYGNILNFKTRDDVNYGSVTDVDGNIYKTVKIGNQNWMAENLKTTKYSNGDPVLFTKDFTLPPDNPAFWGLLTTGSYTIYQTYQIPQGVNVDSIYGNMYNFYTVVDNRNVCPAGWHVPGDAEWTILSDYLGGESSAALRLKEAGDDHWESDSFDAIDEFGFTALPGGVFADNAEADHRRQVGFWWSSTEYDDYSAYSRGIFFDEPDLRRKNDFVKATGLSVRCIEGAMNTASKPKNLTLQTPEADKKSVLTSCEIYPNPAKSILFFRNLPENASASIYDLRGVKLQETNIRNNQIDISKLESGLYFIYISEGNHVVKRKLMVQ